MPEVQLNFLNLNTFLLVGLIILIGGYLYYEIHKMKQILNEYDYQLHQIKSFFADPELNVNNESLQNINNDKVDDNVDDKVDDNVDDNVDDKVDDKVDDNVDDVWNEINDLMEKNEKNNDDLDTLNVSENGSSHIEDLLEENHVPDYNNMTVSQLKNILIDMKLPVSGNKTKLIERINNNK